MPSYQYPDPDDHLTIKFLEALELNEPYWAESEQAVFNFILSYLFDQQKDKLNVFLDAGCGEGRLLPTFAGYFHRGVALEPDERRFEKAKDSAHALKDTTEITCHQIPAESFRSEEPFDFILCSHVIQHIHTGKVIPLLENLRNHLSPNGVIALTTCHSRNPKDLYGKNYLKNGLPVRDIVTIEEFNALVEGVGMLPIHFFSPDLLIPKLEGIGLKTIGFKVFHVSREDRQRLQVADVDAWVNATPERQKSYGVDMCLVLRQG